MVEATPFVRLTLLGMKRYTLKKWIRTEASASMFASNNVDQTQKQIQTQLILISRLMIDQYAMEINTKRGMASYVCILRRTIAMSCNSNLRLVSTCILWYASTGL